MVKLADGLNESDMRNTCTEAGLFAIRADYDYVLEEDFVKHTTKLDSKLDFSKV